MAEATIKLALEEVYKMLCPECKEKLLSLAVKSATTDAVKQQLKEQWEKR